MSELIFQSCPSPGPARSVRQHDRGATAVIIACLDVQIAKGQQVGHDRAGLAYVDATLGSGYTEQFKLIAGQRPGGVVLVARQ